MGSLSPGPNGDGWWSQDETFSPRGDVADSAEPWHEAIGPMRAADSAAAGCWKSALGKLRNCQVKRHQHVSKEADPLWVDPPTRPT